MAQFRFYKGDRVKVTRRNEDVIYGIVRDADYNLCTFKPQYDVDYEKDGYTWTMICVPETAIEKVKVLQHSEGYEEG